MKALPFSSGRIFWAIAICGLVVACWNLAYSPAFSDETINIFMGRQVLAGQNCPLCDRSAGSVLIYPVLSALGDKAGGIAGARAIGAVFALGLAGVLYHTGRVLFSVKHGLVSAILFFFNSTILYLSSKATGDMVAAFLLGLSFLLLILPEKQQSTGHCGLLLFAGAVSLFVSSITVYAVAVFIPPLVLYAFWRHKFLKAFLFFFFPLSVLLSAYIYFALPHDWNSLVKILFPPHGDDFLSASDLGSRLYRFLGIPYLLATFGLFHKEKKGTAFLLVALSVPLVIHRIISGNVQAIEREVIYSIVFLVPAMALGVDHMGSLFSSDTSLSWVKPFFTVAIFIILSVFGIYEFRSLQRQHSDLTRLLVSKQEASETKIPQVKEVPPAPPLALTTQALNEKTVHDEVPKTRQRIEETKTIGINKQKLEVPPKTSAAKEARLKMIRGAQAIKNVPALIPPPEITAKINVPPAKMDSGTLNEGVPAREHKNINSKNIPPSPFSKEGTNLKEMQAKTTEGRHYENEDTKIKEAKPLLGIPVSAALIKRDIRVEVIGEGIETPGVSLHLLKESYPEAHVKSGGGKPIAVDSGEEKGEMRLAGGVSPKKTISVVSAEKGIYTFVIENKESNSYVVDIIFHLYDRGKGEMIRGYNVIQLPSDHALKFKFIMPDMIFWDDEGRFTGSIEDGGSITKFNYKSGLTWKEEKDY